jgi:glucose/arabinose dehydrogenase
MALTPSAPANHILPPINPGSIGVSLTPVATGLGGPTYLTTIPGDTLNRQFVVDQVGLLRVIQNGTILPTAALDLRARMVSPPGEPVAFNPANPNDERGFLGLAFHPGFNNPASPGFRTLYTFNSEPRSANPLTFAVPVEPTMGGGLNNYVNVVAEWKMTSPTSNTVDPASRRVVLTVGKDAGNHNGGTLAFGPDGYLYLALGDGGNANDRGRGHLEPLGNAQVLTGNNVLGKMLRIDPLHPSQTPGSADLVSANGEYRIPASNPFMGPGQVKEIYAYGLRNPFRFSFDSATGQLILADVGQLNIEEIDRIVRGGNYGWAFKEGTFLFNRLNGQISVGPDPIPGLIDPISGPLGTLQYDHGDGIAIIGGFVYHGTGIPELVGKYVFGDLALNPAPRRDGRLLYADLATGEMFEFQFSGRLPDGLTVHGFGQDADGELYALVTNSAPNGTGGIVFKLGIVIPEPSSLALLGLGAAGLIGYAWRRRRPSV